MPKVTYVNCDAVLVFIEDEFVPAAFFRTTDATWLGDVGEHTELWLVQGRLIKVVRRKTQSSQAENSK